MRAAWQLALSSVSARRSRIALLIGAVALSAALITAVATAMRSLNASVSMRTSVVMGNADVRIEPAGSGDTMGEGLVERVRGWEGVEAATGRLRTAVTALAIRKPVLERTGEGAFTPRERILVSGTVGVGVMEQERTLRPLPMIAGRLPARDGEVVLDALLASRLSWRWTSDTDKAQGFALADLEQLRRQLRPLDVPGRARDAGRARDINRRQGVRVGDTVTVVPSFAAPESPERVARNSIAAMNRYPPIDMMGYAARTMRLAGFAADAARLWHAMREPRRLEVVGIAEQPPLGGRAHAYFTLSDLQRFSRRPGAITRIDVMVGEGVDPEAVAEKHRGELPEGVIIQTTERITSGLEKNLQSSQLGFILATVLAVLSASFIIMTGLTTDLAQRQRELAILRCVGSARWQLVQAQLAIGLGIGTIGGAIGIPVGIGVAWLIAVFLPEQVPSGTVIVPGDLAIALAASIGAGVFGAIWPAYRSARMSPLRALSPHLEPVRVRGVAITTLVALGLIALHLGIISVRSNDPALFWVYIALGLPSMFVGYFLLGVPLAVLTGRFLAPALSVALRIPRGLLSQRVGATPYRLGFTSGAMMTGLALIVVIWSNGESLLRDWIGAMEFPDAYVSGLPLEPGAREALDGLPFVEQTSAITREIVGLGEEASLGARFGDRQISSYQTSFIAFEPDNFFRMTSPTWIEGSLEEALPKLRDGSGILIAREFHVARGLGVGDTFTITHKDRQFTFEIVGVVTSPGLDIASKFFNIGEEYTHQAVHAVFGSRSALQRFGSDQVHIVQIDLDDAVDSEQAMAEIRRVLAPYGLLDAGSGVQIKRQIRRFATDTILIFSSIGIVAMLVACFGVANLIVASIDGRRFEFGVLRAIGGSGGLLVRLMLGETLVISIVAAILGVLMGLQAALGGRRIYELILGIQFTVRPAEEPIVLGIVVMTGLTLGAALPAILRLNSTKPRELLAST